MSLFPVAPPPGLVRGGTPSAARGRYYDGDLVRWRGGVLQPVGGWAALAGVAPLGVPVRGMLAFKRATGQAYIALGTRNALRVYSAGVLSAITPAGLAAGSADASGDFYNRTPAAAWQLDAFGEDLVAVLPSDGRLHYWNSSSGTGTPAAPLAGAPDDCRAVVVTDERFIVALGAFGDARLVAWADRENVTDWTSTDTNEAGDFTLTTNGALLAGRRGRDEALLWTDVDLWAMRYIGGVLVYSFRRAGEKCGAISSRAMAVAGDGVAYWMGAESFYAYDGYVRPLPSEVAEYVFSRLNRAQASKVAAVVNSDFGEVTWFYPSGLECDGYVTYNYVEGWWSFGSLARTDGVDRGFLEFPVLAAADGSVYEHENGGSYTDAGGASYAPFAESGPMKMDQGDRVVRVTRYVPDEKTLGEVETTFFVRFQPTGPETTFGPYPNTAPTDVRLTAREVRVRHTQASAGWRVGTPALDVRPGGLR